MGKNYLQSLALLGVGGAHPGGLRLTKKILDEQQALKPSLEILDVGCGTGQTAAYLAKTYGCKLTVIDNNTIMLEKAKKRFSTQNLDVNVVHGNAENVPFKDQRFDLILCESVIAFTDMFQTIYELKRVLKSSGQLYAIEMVLAEGYQLAKDELMELKNFYGVSGLLMESEWIKLFESGGFRKIISEQYAFSFDPDDVENAPDFSISDDITEETFNVLQEHQQLTKKYRDILSFRVFKCLP